MFGLSSILSTELIVILLSGGREETSQVSSWPSLWPGESKFGNVELLPPKCDIAIIRDNTTASDEIDS